ncbi:MAG: helix-turn-helix domain-containing protein [Negativicutes bacterium]|nr:helix-turn-helix domain-containing protein [Negativicutes bacterium]
MDIGAKLRSLRKLREMTVEELSRLSGVSRSYITNIENGRKTQVSGKIITSLASALGINPDYFFIREAQLPTDCLPNLGPEFIALLSHSDSMPFLKLTKKAIENGVSAETVEAVVDVIIKAQQRKSP